jgi:hypothetical protein
LLTGLLVFAWAQAALGSDARQRAAGGDTAVVAAADFSKVPLSNWLYDPAITRGRGEVVVRFVDKDLQPPSTPETMGPRTTRAIRSAVSDSIVRGAAVRKEYDRVVSGLALVKLPAGTSVHDAVTRFNQSANILYAEPNYKYRFLRIPNDPNFPQQWALHNTGQTGGTVDADIDGPEAWDIQTGSKKVLVAVADSGIDYKHPDLGPNLWMNTKELFGLPNVDDDGNGYADDFYGYDFVNNDGDPADDVFHGTFCAGIIGAMGNNMTGIAGVCWNASIVALKVGDANGVSLDAAIAAIEYATAIGAKVINASWGGYQYSQALKDAIDAAGESGVLFAAAAGNDSSDNDQYPLYPASYECDNIISVMATDQDDQIAWFSNYGASSVDIAEPGAEIISTTPTSRTQIMTLLGLSTDYAVTDGTSMAAPHVSGAAALLWSQYPSLSSQIVKQILLQTADRTLPGLCLSGGRVNVHKALEIIPKGKPGRVLNTRDDPGNPASYYKTIQSAIDAANNGDVLIAETFPDTNSIFVENIDFRGKAITLRSGDVKNPSDPTIYPESTFILGYSRNASVVTFAGNEGAGSVLKGITLSLGNADYGGGVRCDQASPTISDCLIVNNFAKYYGGGIDCYRASPKITNCVIAGNRAFGKSGTGGGINCEEASANIANCNISDNFASNIGGGIACYYASPAIFNCFITNNSAVYKSGGIDCEASSPVITNCTIVVDQANPSKDGGIFAYQGSSPVIKNCILWGNGDDLYGCSAIYCAIEDDEQGIGNIHSAPLFVRGPRGSYYLSQTSAGQLNSSPCVDAGDLNTNPLLRLQIRKYTTRTDGVVDANTVDMGAHYLPAVALLFQLTVTVVDANGVAVQPALVKGYVDPNSGTYRQYEVVRLRAYPQPGYRIKTWTGTDNDASVDPNNTATVLADAEITIQFEEIPLYQLRTSVVGEHGTISPYHRRGQSYLEGTVVALTAAPAQTYIVDKWTGTDNDKSWATTNVVIMDSDKEVTVEFRQPKSLYVPGQHRTISGAIIDAYKHGDKIIVAAGTYLESSLDFDGKAITIASEHPDDPRCVAVTVIDCQRRGRAFIFQKGEGPDAVIDGFTIVNGSAVFDPNTPPDTGGTGADGQDGYGGAIGCFNGSSPTISNLVIRNCIARGRDGEDGSSVFDPPSAPPAAPAALDPLDPSPDPPDIDPNDPNTYDPNNVVTPGDPNSPIDGMDGQAGQDGQPGQAGMDGANGQPGYAGGKGGNGYGGALYFDANSAPTILHCTIINCQAIGADGGFGGQAQDGYDGQDGQDSQPGQDGQAGQDGFNGGADGAGGAGGAGGPGGNGGKGGDGGRGGDGGDGGEALGGAIYFGPNCRPTIKYCTITNSVSRQGMGSGAGSGGNGGNAGSNGAGADGGGGGDPNGADGQAGADGSGGNGGTGGDGGNMSRNGQRSWAGAIFYGENCQVKVSDTVISYNSTTTSVPLYAYSAGNAGNGGNGGDTGGNGGDGGAGGWGQPVGAGGTGGSGGQDGGNGANGGPGLSDFSFTSSFAGGNYYDVNCTVELTDCTISYNISQFDDGGGEDYKDGCKVSLVRCEYAGNSSGYNGGALCFDQSCSAKINDCNFNNNTAVHDGGGLYYWYDCSLDISDSRFTGNLAVQDQGAGGAIYIEQGATAKVKNSKFVKNRAVFGGGLYWYGQGSDVAIFDSVINENTAEQGGGLFWSGGAPTISGCGIKANKATGEIPTLVGTDYADVYGGGGGMFCWSSGAVITSCFITDNMASGSGGGVYFGGDPCSPILKNCLVKGNSATLDGGGIVSCWSVAPTISNCTIVDNRAYGSANRENGRGGGLSCSYESQTALINSILWGNTATIGNQIAIGSVNDPVYLQRPASLTVSYCDIRGGRSPQAIYVEPGRILSWLAGNIDADPIFTGPYYLSQTAAGQGANSPCVNAGSDSAVKLGLDTFTTRTDAVFDQGIADIGLHYPAADRYKLTVNVIGKEHGSVDPNGGLFGKFAAVTLTAKVFPGYRVRWLGTDDDTSGTLSNTVTIYSDTTVTVIIEIPKTINVPGDYPQIQQAVDAAGNGDVVVINKGRYMGGDIRILGKAITLSSTNPDDPSVVAQTIIDCNGYITRGVYFSRECGPDTILTGLTIANCSRVTLTMPTPSAPGADGPDGLDILGGGIFIDAGASPTILNCVISNCQISAGAAAAGAGGGDNANDPTVNILRAHYGRGETRNGGYGGNGGNAFGGGIYCGPHSSPTIRNCRITDSVVTGANAGAGGTGFNPDNNAGDPNGGDGGHGGHAGAGYGGGIYLGYGSTPTISDCVIANCTAVAGNGGDGGNGGNALATDNAAYGGWGGYGGDGGRACGAGIYFAAKVKAAISNCQIINGSATAGNAGDGGDFGNANSLVGSAGFGGGFFGDYWLNSAYGGGVYCGAGSQITLEKCTFSGNSITGGMSGVGGAPASGTGPDPQVSYLIPTYGAGVFADSQSQPVFTGCDITGNFAVDVNDPNDPNLPIYRLTPYISYGGGICYIEANAANVKGCYFSDNNATLGGGMYWSQTNSTVADSNFAGNVAFKGGGIYCSDSVASTISGSIFSANQAGQPGGEGGAIYCSSTPALIVDCQIRSNQASVSGGGVYSSGGAPGATILRNCLIANNSAGRDGGGISCNWQNQLLISNCTVHRNIARNVNVPTYGAYGGGLSCSYASYASVINSIFWENDGSRGSEISIGSGFAADPRPATVAVSYSDIEGSRGPGGAQQVNPAAVFVDAGCTLNWDFNTNIDQNPLFVARGANAHYLSQIAARQTRNSPCVDVGSADANSVGLAGRYSTRTDAVPDANIVDMGYHYGYGAGYAGVQFELIVTVTGPGTVTVEPNAVDPNNRLYDPNNKVYTYKADGGTLFVLTAVPDVGYRVKAWRGTNNDPSWSRNTNTVTLDRNRAVVIELEPDAMRNMLVPSEYRTIEDAVVAAGPGGTSIIVSQGIHYVTNPNGIDFRGKVITLTSTDPNDPNVVAKTIIECRGGRYNPMRAFYFHSGEDPRSIVTGFTIRNGYMRGLLGADGQPGMFTPVPYERIGPNLTDPPRAQRGAAATGDGYGGAILCENGSSPTIKSCVITNCMVTAAQGGHGAIGQSTIPEFPQWSFLAPEPGSTIQQTNNGQWGGHAGIGSGNGFGGAIACLSGSNPVIVKCTIKDNTAMGGVGGNGGNGGSSTSGGQESWGGNGGAGYGDGQGGGIYCDGASTPKVIDCRFINNVARCARGGPGGAVGSGQPLTPNRAQPGVVGLTIPAGRVSGGAAYYATNTDPNFANCTFLRNKAYNAYSAIDEYLRDAEAFIDTLGGALYAEPGNTVTLVSCQFVENYGGAVYVESGCKVDVNDCLFRGNEAIDRTFTDYAGYSVMRIIGPGFGPIGPGAPAPPVEYAGGAIYLGPDCPNVNIRNCRFYGNAAWTDGGAVRSESSANFTNSVFGGNKARDHGGAIDVFYDTNDPNTHRILTLDLKACSFAGNLAYEGFDGWGGGVHFQDFNATFTDCYFVGNTAKNGGGLFLAGGNVNFKGGMISDNKAIGASRIDTAVGFDLAGRFGVSRGMDLSAGIDIGGGMVCADTQATIENCTLSNNAAEGVNGSGGAINFYGGHIPHLVKNCLLTGNSAKVYGGAISCNLFAKPQIRNCTFSNNTAGKLGGAIFCDWSSDVIVTDSIIQAGSNHAIAEMDFGGAVAKYCLFYNNPAGDYGLYDTVAGQITTLTYSQLDAKNKSGDPLFVAGPLGGFYLSQTTAGQAASSPAVNAGSGFAFTLGMNTLTTRTDSLKDTGIVDMGYHFLDHTQLAQFKLAATVVDGHGKVDPTSGTYYAGTLVGLTAIPDNGYRVATWTGTANDASTAKTNILVMLWDNDVTVRFNQPRTIVVSSDPNYTTIQRAIDEAVDGDIVIVKSGTYQPPYPFNNIQIIDKGITLTGTNPDDANVVAATVLEGYRLYVSTVGSEAIIDGITFTNGYTIPNTIVTGGLDVFSCSPTIRNCVFSNCRIWGVSWVTNPTTPPDDGLNGGSVEGGAITIINGSPIIENCRFTGCSAIGGNGAPGDNASAGHDPGYDGGWGGWGYGGAVYCGFNSNPVFQDCSFTDCYAQGGNGGNGGAGANNYPGGRGGSWEWSPSEETGPGSSYWYYWDGWQYAPYDVNGLLIYDLNPPFEGRYKDYWKYSGYGGAVYCENESSPKFNSCKFTNNRTYGGASGVGGLPGYPYDILPVPNRPINIENFGGALYACYGSNPEFVDCNFTSNFADQALDAATPADPNIPDDIYVSYGGAVAIEDDCWVKFTDCNIVDSNSCIGGGLWWSKSKATIVDCNFADNIAYHGGALYSVESTGSIKDSTFARNQAFDDPNDPNGPTALGLGPVYGQGGGYYCLASVVDISGSVFTENRASGSGGAIYYAGSDQNARFAPLLFDSLLTGNRAGRDGGAISANWYAEPTISSCTIADNIVTGSLGVGPGYGGGLYCSYESNVKIIDSIIWGNEGVDGSQIAVATGFEHEPRPSSLTISYSDVGPPFDPNRLDIFDLVEKAAGDWLASVGGGSKLVDGQTINDQFDAGADRVKVLVSLAEPDGMREATNWDSPASVSQLRAEIATRRSTVLASLGANEFAVRHTYENLAAVSGEVTRQGLEKLLGSALVRHVEPVREVKYELAQAIPLANALEVRQAYDGKGVAIAIVDSGIDYTHPMLGGGTFPNNKVIGGYDFGSNDPDPMPEGEAHGTCCAGIVAGSLGHVGDYIGGVAFNARIYALKISVGMGPPLTDAALAAWDWCITHRNDNPAYPIKAMSNSWGRGIPFDDPVVADAYSPAFTAAADTAVAVGITVLAASGNDGFAGQGIGWPAAISKVVSVGAVYDTTDLVAFYSDTAENLDILAPADPVYTTDIVGPLGYDPGDYFPYFNGTSSACPFAAGAVACIQTAALEKLGRYLTPAEVKYLLVTTGDPVTDTKVAITKPRINLGRAVTSPSGPPVYVGKGCTLNGWLAPDSNNYWSWDAQNWDGNVIEEDPNFIYGYYLSQFAAGQAIESNCVDGGSDLSTSLGAGLANNLGLGTYTTRIDGVADVNVVDMGYHYKHAVAKHQLTVLVAEDPNAPGIHGAVEPNSGWFLEGAELTLAAKPNPGYYIQGWYDVNDILLSYNKEVDVVMDANHVYKVRFRLPKNIEVSGGGNAIRQALNTARNGDTLIVAAGSYDGDINFQGKEIKLVSTNPDDPNVTAYTIINCNNSTRAFTFNGGEDAGTIVDGFTVINGGLFAQPGGAIYVGDGSSPTIVNVTISDCNVAFASGGAIYVDANCSPTFRNVTITNCITTSGGNGGGVYVHINASPTFAKCVISDCSTEGFGGAVYCSGGSSAVFTDCNLVNNYANYSGGGFYYDANAVSTLTRCNIAHNRADARGGGIRYNLGCSVQVSDCNFVDNTAAEDGGALYFDPNCSGTISKGVLVYNDANNGGGAIYLRDCNALSVADCNIAYNTAIRGGGLYCADSAGSKIIACSIKHNEASQVWYEYFVPDPNGQPVPIPRDDPAFDPQDPNLIVVKHADRSVMAQGGGIYSFAGPALIGDSEISYNQANTSGGGLYLTGGRYELTTLKNCLVANNLAGRDGGGLSCSWFDKLVVSNCTFAGNKADDPNSNDPNFGGFGGGLFCSYDSSVDLIDSILWANNGSKSSQIYVGMGLDANHRRPSMLAVSYCDVGGWKGPKDVNVIDPNVVFAEPGCGLDWDFGTVIDADPRFVNAYFLSHTAAGQVINSKCIDAGSDLAGNLNLSTFTTRIDGVADIGIVDIGYHYPAAAYQLRVDVAGGNGSVDPNRGTYNRNAVLTLRAKPNPGYRVQGWYDVNNVLLSVDRTMEVVMDADVAFVVRFERAQTADVSGGGNAIQVAIDRAKSGDVLVVAAGTYNGNISLRGKDIIVVCTNPDDPNIIGSTIIDCQQSGRGFIFNNAEDANTVVNGFTIINGSVTGQGGGGIYIDPNSSPTIINVTINNCSAAQANGGGIYVDANSSPTFINCTITNCSAVTGGGAFCDFNSAPTFNYCLFGDNSADLGAGLYYDANCVSKVLECRFTGNSAAQDGGGLYCDPNSIITIADCNFADNSAVRGGGLYCDPNCWVTVAKTIFSDNTASADGGAVYLYHANVSISDSTIVSNSALRGGGLWCYDSPATTVTGCTIRYNRAGPLFDPNDPNDPNALVIGAGGGVYCFATAGLIRDCIVTHNIANTSGGGIYVAGDVNSPAIKNSLIVYNFAGRDGGGVSVNWHARPTISTCTFVGNAAAGTYGDLKKTGIGGGLYCSYHALANVTDSIFWKNFALRGHELAVGTGFEYDPRYGTLSVSYCDIEAGRGEVEVDTGCTLNWGPGNINSDPFFVTGRLDSFYLSQVAAGQLRKSPCVDAGSSYASDLGLVGYTTRTDEVADTLKVDMGYHHPTAQPCRFCDLVYDGIINFRDFAILAEKWLAKGCSDTNTWCQGRDFTFDTLLNMEDIAFLADCWLVRDTEPPVPDPSLWEVEPYVSSPSSVTMAAELAFDAWGWNVQYYFQCFRGNCHDSGWRDSPAYTDTGLTAGTRYAYRVKARDEIGNETEWSIVRYAGEEDRTPPAPAPEWEREPYALSDDAIAMIATPAFDDSGVEYYFQSVSGGGHDSGWLNDRSYTDTNIDPNTEYCYRVKARDGSPNHNETAWSTVACATTLLPPDTTPPTPNPMQFDPNGAPQEIYGGGGTWDYYATMTAVVAADASGFVQYYFECVDAPGLSSGWQAANTYTVLVGRSGQGLRFRVMARDLYGNVTAWSPALPALP